MEAKFSRTQLLIKESGLKKLSQSKVIVFGIGGVGGFVIEALVRAGIGTIEIVDNDDVDISNINRQIIATMETIGRDKADVMKERILSINPECQVIVNKDFYTPEKAEQYHWEEYDYVVDAIDTVKSKIDIILQAQRHHTKVISCMGMGNKIDPELLFIDDIYHTKVDPLAKVMRLELKKRRVKRCKVCYSIESPIAIDKGETVRELDELKKAGATRRAIPGSISFVPSTAGLMIASVVVRDLLNIKSRRGC